LESKPAPPPSVSIVITVRNEGRHIRPLLESLAAQEPPYEVVLVDALSHDDTVAVAQAWADSHPGVLRIYRQYGSRGIGRNLGVRASTGEFVAFTDGDCVVDPNWLHELRGGLRRSDVAAGRTVVFGHARYANLDRVELYQQGNDVTYPSCNLAYRRGLFESLGGFDPRFITAEDIDLNLRAVRRGVRIEYVPEAVVRHQARESILRFLEQAFWNGYGRKQLTEKQGSLWAHYQYRRLFAGQRSLTAWARLVAAFAGYFTRVLTGGNRRLSAPLPPSELSPEGGSESANSRSSA
jgi:GT2 family glycosyltransferase